MGKRVLLLLADGFEPLEAAGFTDVLGWANIDGEEPIELVSAGLRPMLRATFGFSVVPDRLVKELDLDTFDALAVPGGFEGAGFYHDALSSDFSEVINRFNAAGKPVASVCVAALGAVYLSLVDVWMKDKTPDLSKTMAAIDRRLDLYAQALDFMKR